MSLCEEKSEIIGEFSEAESFKINPSSNIFRSGISKKKLMIHKPDFISKLLINAWILHAKRHLAQK